MILSPCSWNSSHSARHPRLCQEQSGNIQPNLDFLQLRPRILRSNSTLFLHPPPILMGMPAKERIEQTPRLAKVINDFPLESASKSLMPLYSRSPLGCCRFCSIV